MSKSDNNSGCFFTIALICGLIIVLYLIGQALQSVGKTYKEDPSLVMMWIFIIGLIAYVIYRLKKSD
jgi:uncharacterized protein with PQ loop repeat